MKIISVVGARPNFMKMAPVHKEFEKLSAIQSSCWEGSGQKSHQEAGQAVEHLICHTGQHYDEKMSKVFFTDLELPQPDFYLGVGSGSHAEQTAKVMIEFEKVLIREKPDLVIVYGDVNSTVACSLVAAKMGVKIAHVESGLRSFDHTMPEEVNRILTDHLSDYLFVTEKSGIENLRREGISEDNIFFVGNTMIDSLVTYLPQAERSTVLKLYNVRPSNYILVTLHRPTNVDDIENVEHIIRLLNKLAEKRKIIFPVHPRTKTVLERLNSDPTDMLNISPNLILTDPIGYIDFLCLMKNAEFVITDSGGIQEETTFLNVQCITVRENTERPVTVDIGTNYLIGTNLKRLEETAIHILDGKIKNGKIPLYWDGSTSQRVVETLVKKSLI